MPCADKERREYACNHSADKCRDCDHAADAEQEGDRAHDHLADGDRKLEKVEDRSRERVADGCGPQTGDGTGTGTSWPTDPEDGMAPRCVMGPGTSNGRGCDG